MTLKDAAQTWRTVLILRPSAGGVEAWIKRWADGRSGVEWIACDSPWEAIDLARTLPSALMICHFSRVESVRRFLPVLRQLGESIAVGKVKLLFTAFSGGADPGAGEIRAQLEAIGAGSSEILEEPLSEQGFLLALESSLARIRRGEEDVPAAPGSGLSESLANAQPPFRVLAIGPLELESDCWIFRKEGVRKIGGRWHLRMLGPPPVAGEWSEIGPECWLWVPSDPDRDVFIREQGGWVFRGEKPVFRDGGWNFAAKEPELSFYFEGDSCGSKFRLDEQGALLMASESAHSLRALQAIRQILESLRPAKPAVREFPGKPREPRMRKVAALELPEDCWLIQERRARFIGVVWTVGLRGPDPLAGRWHERPGESSDDSLWEWVPNPPQATPVRGSWIFRGNPPRFENDVWILGGRSPDLSFRAQDADALSLGSKLKVDFHGDLLVAEDSEQAGAALSSAKREAALPAKPPLSPEVPPLGLAMMASELLARPGVSVADLARRYCAFLSTLLQEARVEFWIQSPRTCEWKPVAAHDGKAATLLEPSGQLAAWDARVVEIPETNLRLVIESEYAISAQLLNAAARMAYGIARSAEASDPDFEVKAA